MENLLKPGTWVVMIPRDENLKPFVTTVARIAPDTRRVEFTDVLPAHIAAGDYLMEWTDFYMETVHVLPKEDLDRLRVTLTRSEKPNA